MLFQIEQAAVTQAKAKIAIVGIAGSGKTYTALVTAKELGSKILVIDTENKTSSKYANLLGPYDILALPNYALKTYIEALGYSAKRGYDVVIVDSLSHAWAGKGGALEQVDQASVKFKGNKFAGWGEVTPLQNQLVDTILSYPVHLIATMRMKTDYILTKNDQGRDVPQKVGMGVVQRDSFEYEFDVIAQMDTEHNLVITKTRCFELDGFIAHKPDGTMGKMIATWLSTGQPIPPAELTYEPIQQAAPAPQPATPSPHPKTGPTKAAKTTYRNHTDDLFDEVQKRTDNYYHHKAHLFNALGVWPANDPAAVAEAVLKAVQHVTEKSLATDEPTAITASEEIAF